MPEKEGEEERLKIGKKKSTKRCICVGRVGLKVLTGVRRQDFLRCSYTGVRAIAFLVFGFWFLIFFLGFSFSVFFGAMCVYLSDR